MTSELQACPLLTGHFPIQFDAVRADQVEPAIHQLLNLVKQRVRSLSDPQNARTYKDIVLALDSATEPLDFAMGIVRHLESVATTPELRNAYNAVQEPVSLFHSSIALDEDLWRAVKAVEQAVDKSRLEPVHRRFLEKTVTGFRRAGADLSPKGKKRLEELDVALTKATTKFSQNVLDATNAYELVIEEESKLAGLPPSAIEAARESAKNKGREGWRFTLQAPSFIAATKYLNNREIRRELWFAFHTRAAAGSLDNRPLIAEILRLRREKAQLLGYADFADFVLDERMAHTGRRAQDFVEDLRRKTLPFFEKENQSLEQVGRELGYQTLEPWDIAYVAEKQRVALYQFDEEELRPYFELDRVVAGMFGMFSQLLGIKVVEQPGVPVWDPAVKYFKVEDAASGAPLGGFYTDWFPRENKRDGAWMGSLFTGNPNLGQPHVGLICGNVTPPIGGKPSLLTHREVETVFHEFGHLLHHTLSLVPVKSLSGTSVPWDFVELPSQIMENWCGEREALNQFARHYQTGAPIPEDLFQKMRRARNFRSANFQMRQLAFGMVDLKLHREYDPAKDGEVMAYARNIFDQFSASPLPQNYAMLASFTHLFASPVGYGAGYYSYKWAEVLDADAFTRFQKEGIFNPATGRDYRRAILERGDSDDPAQLYRLFMGRDPDANALLERLGLLTAAA